ncbi:hypothetical protein [Ruegeria sp. HKCCA5763]|uniref:hypothetical protein n=1 Tax=Ruegeria sp. HKCCA5763 TaxID=2682987 RepID=UPI00148767EA|nr:hypothetical protein [Ruegeria sp. HKCCA5763]
MQSIYPIALATVTASPVFAFEEAIDYALTLDCRSVSICEIADECKSMARALQFLLVRHDGNEGAYFGHSPAENGYYTKIQLLDEGFHGKPNHDFSTSVPDDHAVDFRGGDEFELESGVLFLAYVPRGYEWIERNFKNTSLSEFLVEFQGCESN